MKTLTRLRSIAVGRANTLQRLHPHLPSLLPAFHAWLAGEVFVGGRGKFRLRDSREVAPWNALVGSLFADVADFAFAAAVFSTTPASKAIARIESPKTPAPSRVDVVALAKAA